VVALTDEVISQNTVLNPAIALESFFCIEKYTLAYVCFAV
jgi:hypothetical protein